MLSYPKIEKFCQFPVNREIHQLLLPFVNDEKIHVASLIQNPFGKTKNTKEIKKHFGSAISKIIETLNELHQSKNSIFKKYTQYKSIIILFLLNYNLLFEKNLKDTNAKKMLSQKKIRFAMQLLEHLDVTGIRLQLEDKLFSLLEPSLYNNYHALLKITKKKYISKRKEILKDFKSILEKNAIRGKIESRVKTIYSIHTKITKRNLLFSQILDVIGLRIIVENEEDCYKTMVVILKNSPVMTSRVKDYIAIPKQNGYQSIHLTIIHNNHPVEIQIRTKEMHKKAQYGIASHMEYKRTKKYALHATA